MIREAIMEWVMIAVLVSAAFFLSALVVGTSYEAGAKHGKNEAEVERRERVEWRCWCDEWAETRAAQEAYLQERRRR